MYQALSSPDSDGAVFVAVLSVANCFGRLLVGASSQRLERTFPRPFFLFITTAVMALSMLYMAFASVDMLYFGCVIVGLAYGSYWALLPSITSDLFGQNSLSANYNFLSLST